VHVGGALRGEGIDHHLVGGEVSTVSEPLAAAVGAAQTTPLVAALASTIEVIATVERTDARITFFIIGSLLVGGVGRGLRQQVLGVGLGSLVIALLGVLAELRDSDRGEDTDNRDNDHQLDQGKTLLQLGHMDSPREEVRRLSLRNG
jgi:hypothetical protein